MFFAVYLDLDRGIGSLGSGSLLVFASDKLLQIAQIDIKDQKLGKLAESRNRIYFGNCESGDSNSQCTSMAPWMHARSYDKAWGEHINRHN